MDNPAVVKVDVNAQHNEQINWMQERFRSFLPVVVDIETGGYNEKTDALLEFAVVVIGVDRNFKLYEKTTLHYHVKPFQGSNLEATALKVNGIDPYSPLRLALDEREALTTAFNKIHAELQYYRCSRAILVGHNSFFDLKFLNAAIHRSNVKNNPFHKFSSLDTVTLGALAYKQTVLAKIADVAGYEWNANSAHSALYDAQATAKVFCKIFNSYETLPSANKESL